MNDLMERCANCSGGVIQDGSLAGNKCRQCVDGYVLSPDGWIFYELLRKRQREEV